MLISIALLVQIGEDHLTEGDIIGIVAFLAGASFVVALFHGRKNKDD